MVMMGLITDIYIPNIVIIGMVSLFAASVRSPITGTLLILEMTGDFGHLMSLALASAVAYIVAELLHGEPIYDSLLKRSLASHPDKKRKSREPSSRYRLQAVPFWKTSLSPAYHT